MPEIPDYAYILWDDIQDIIGPVNIWPKSMIRLFWKPNLSHMERLKVAAFTIINGLNPEVTLEWIELMGLARTNESLRDFKYFLQQFDMNENGKWNRIYQYNMYSHCWEYLDGTVKYRLPLHVVPQW